MTDRMQLKVNGSGCYDFTAYLAIMNVEGCMTNSRENYTEGDIVVIEKANGQTDQVLLVKLHDSYASGVTLREKAPFENAGHVIGKQKMYFDAGRTCYVFYDTISDYVKTVNEEDLARVRLSIAKAFGIEMSDQPITTSNSPAYDGGKMFDLLSLVNDTVSVIGEQVDAIAASAPASTSMEKVIRAEAERDVYKALYEQERMNHTIVA